ncbi:MAG: hypothetical protein K9M54_08810 [Kiritimatiellales bacterium]|nr:hypothetical protein [Kiritimatiellales bacterium]MCF7863961.1 hypothetical protein [Kiritimatiellales bacterium]
MKILFLMTFACLTAAFGRAGSTIDPASKHAYGANFGWVNAEGDTTNGAVIGQAFCSGYMYCANAGWIDLGNGAPANGIAYANNSATDYGINHDGLGNLTGYAYGVNIGWINFEQAYGKPKVNLQNGLLVGYAWSANAGWIKLAGMVTLTLDPGPDSDADGIPDAWEYGRTNTLAVLSGGDADHDGMSDVNEYLANTDPFDPSDILRIIAFEQEATADYVTWPLKQSRRYVLQRVDVLGTNIVWDVARPAFVSGVNLDFRAKVSKSPTNRFFRVEASLPLGP